MLRLHLSSEHPPPRDIHRAVEILRSGGLGIYPTDTTYGLGCDVYQKRSVERIYKAKKLDKRHPLSLICSDLSEAATHAVIENRNFRILRRYLPGGYTFILPASRQVPRLVQSKARTVGIRIPENPVALALVAELGRPIISTTVPLRPDDPHSQATDTDEIARVFGKAVDVFLDVGPLFGEPTSVIDLTGTEPAILRRGSGDLSWIE